MDELTLTVFQVIFKWQVVLFPLYSHMVCCTLWSTVQFSLLSWINLGLSGIHLTGDYTADATTQWSAAIHCIYHKNLDNKYQTSKK